MVGSTTRILSYIATSCLCYASLKHWAFSTVYYLLLLWGYQVSCQQLRQRSVLHHHHAGVPPLHVRLWRHVKSVSKKTVVPLDRKSLQSNIIGARLNVAAPRQQSDQVWERLHDLRTIGVAMQVTACARAHPRFSISSAKSCAYHRSTIKCNSTRWLCSCTIELRRSNAWRWTSSGTSQYGPKSGNLSHIIAKRVLKQLKQALFSFLLHNGFTIRMCANYKIRVLGS